jgi:uncharacterized protein (TIGR01777 family)
MINRVLITGGSGFVGVYLTKHLLAKGYKVSVLSRSIMENTSDVNYFLWDIEAKTIDKTCLDNVQTIIHLAGENVASGRWSETRKKRILQSRIESTELLYDLLSTESHVVKSFISASAIGIYGSVTSDLILEENNIAGTDFLANVCEQWESSIFKVNTLGIRTVALRTGIVLASDQGALAKMRTPFKLGFGSALASGNQYIPWIHIHDLCQMYVFAMENQDIKGAFNAVVGDEVTNEEFSRKFAKAVKRPLFMPNIPKFIMQLIFGEMSVILTEGSRISSEKIKAKGFQFSFSNLSEALEKLFKS